MALVNTPGAATVMLGPNIWQIDSGAPAQVQTTIDAANEAVHLIGHCVTEDGNSHTIDTTGSSIIQWRTGTVTFANVGSTFKVGIAEVDRTSAVTVARAVNVADVITFDVSADFTGGGGGVPSAAWQNSVPTTGAKTIANGDLIAVCMQMTARAGVDSVIVQNASGSTGFHLPTASSFLGGSYTNLTILPDCIFRFSDGAYGWIHLSEVRTSVSTLTYDNNDTPSEYGQLYNLPFGTKIYGLYGWADIDNDAEMVLYSDPLGTPVPEKAVVIDSSVRAAATGRRQAVLFPSPYTYTKNTNIVVVYKPTTTAVISAYSKTLANANHRFSDVWGTSGYGVSRAGGTGAFANINSSLDHVYAGLIVGAFDDGAGGGGGLNTLGGRGGVIS